MDPKLLMFARGTPFTGAEGDNWDSWISRFEVRTSNLKPEERLPVLLSLLDGKAIDVCASLSPDDRKNYAAVKAALAGRFGAEVDQLQAFAAFAHATRQPGEDAPTFGERLNRLARWTYKTKPKPMTRLS